MTTHPLQETVLIVVVGYAGEVSATVRAVDGSHAAISSSDTLPRFLARTSVPLPDGRPVQRIFSDDTPIVRYDLTDWDTAVAFTDHGPIRHPGLPPNTIQPIDGPPCAYLGQPWHELGESIYASIDVHTALAEQAGVVVHRVGRDQLR